MKLEVTGDGSHTIISSIYDVRYHSIHGALTESCHVFINAGLRNYCERNPAAKSVSIFEMGFGTGLNALLSYDFSRTNRCKLRYTGIDLVPLHGFQKLNYTQNSFLARHEEIFYMLHSSEWNKAFSINNFDFMKLQGDFLLAEFQQKHDVIYYDAFGPNTQDELWTTEALSKCYDLLNDGGLWVSYCAKGQVRRNLQEVGFAVERVPGPPGKREMLRATKSTS